MNPEVAKHRNMASSRHSLGQLFSNGGDFHICQHPGHLVVTTQGKGCDLHLAGRGQRCCSTFYNARGGPRENSRAQYVKNCKISKP